MGWKKVGQRWLEVNLGLLLHAFTLVSFERREERECWVGDGTLRVEVRRRWIVARCGGSVLRFKRRRKLPPLLSAAAAVYQLAAGAVGKGVAAPPQAAVRVLAAGKEVRTTVIELVRLWEREGWKLMWNASSS